MVVISFDNSNNKDKRNDEEVEVEFAAEIAAINGVEIFICKSENEGLILVPVLLSNEVN